MEKRINVAEILKDCPTGMELDCAMYENCNFLDVETESNRYLIRITTPCGIKYFDKYGCYTTNDKSKCVIFPKGKTSWENFQRPFKDGDVLADIKGNIFIYKGQMWYNKLLADFYCGYRIFDRAFVPKIFKDKHFGDISECHFASEKEKQKLFNIIKDNGYKWDEKTRTLEKLIEPESKFKEGDILYTVTGEGRYYLCIVDCIIGGILYTKASCSCSGHFLCTCEEQTDIHKLLVMRLATEDEKQILFDAIKASGYKWNAETKTLEELPKFKVGDRIKSLYNNLQYDIKKLTDTHYTLVGVKNKFEYTEPIIEDKNWELVSDKFDFNTLKPFDKVLVRLDKNHRWVPQFFSRYNLKSINFPFECMHTSWPECIPYKGNEHLANTTNDCDDFYKIWKV